MSKSKSKSKIAPTLVPKSKEPHLLELLQKATDQLVALWDTQGEIEKFVGHDLEDQTDMLDSMAVDGIAAMDYFFEYYKRELIRENAEGSDA